MSLLIAIGLSVSSVLIGQTYSGNSPVYLTIPEIAILDIEPSNTPVQLSIVSLVEGGEAINTSVENDSKWLNYTCSVSNNTNLKNIYVQTMGNGVPEGIQFEMTVGGAVGGAGALGTPNNNVIIGDAPKLIISDIGGSYTGNGASFGHQLTYKISIGNYENLNSLNSQSIQLLFTISD